MKDFLTYLTSSFLTHINYELGRSDEVLNSIDMGEEQVRTRLEKIHREIFEFFPNIKPIEYNFAHELFVTKLHRESYYSTSFEGFDIVFWGAIKDLFSLTKESRESYKEISLFHLEKLDHKKFGLNMQIFLRRDAELREILSGMIRVFYGNDEKKIKEVWSFFYEQNMQYQQWLVEYFESLLIDAWKKSEDLLNNILPIKITDELKRNHKVESVHIQQASVLFTDFKGFTQLTENMGSKQLVNELDICFKEFDIKQLKSSGGGTPYCLKLFLNFLF